MVKGLSVASAELGSYWDYFVSGAWRTEAISSPGTAFLQGPGSLKMAFPSGPGSLVK